MIQPLECNLNQQDLSEIGGYLICLSDLTNFLKDKKGTINIIDLLDTVIATNSIVKSIVDEAKESGDYTKDMVDKETPAKFIAGPDALLMDNPVFERSYTQGIIDRLHKQLGLKP